MLPHRPPRAFAHFLIVSALLAAGCSTAQKASFSKALTGSAAPAQGQPPGGIIGATQAGADAAAGISAATAGTPIGGYATIATGIFTGLLALERLLLAFGLSLPNSKSSPSQSNSASGGGTNSGTGQPSGSQPLRPAA